MSARVEVRVGWIRGARLRLGLLSGVYVEYEFPVDQLTTGLYEK